MLPQTPETRKERVVGRRAAATESTTAYTREARRIHAGSVGALNQAAQQNINALYLDIHRRG